MHLAIISLYETGAAGPKALSSFLKSRGHRASIIFYGQMGRTHKEFHQFSKVECSENAVRWCGERDKEDLIGLLHNLKPDLIGISVRSAFLQPAIELTQTLQKESSSPVLWGGIHPTICPEESIQYADILCRGEGEYATLDLMTAMAEKRDITAIPNLWIKEGGKIFRNDLRLLNDLDALPFADHGEEDKYYVYSRPVDIKSYTLMTSIGCPFSCSFCCNSILREAYKGKGRYVRRRSVDHVIAELLFAKREYAITDVIFQDDIFVDDPRWLGPFLEEYEKKINLPFACYLHSKFVTEPLIASLKKAGLYTAAMGIQSGSERVRRDIYKRKQTNDEIVRSASLLNPQLTMAYDIIIDNPFETHEDLAETLHLLLQFPYPFRVHLLTLTFFPKYPITLAAVGEGLIPKANAGLSIDEWLMVYREDRPKKTQSLYLLIAATQYEAVGKDFIRAALRNERLLKDPRKLFSLLDQTIGREKEVQSYRSGEKTLEYLEGIQTILLIPSGDISVTGETLEILLEKYPNALCSVLSGTFSEKYSAILPQEKVASIVREKRRPVETIYHDGRHGKAGLLGIDYGLISELRKRRFDLVALIHGNRDGWGYIHLELLAMLSGAKHRLIFKPDRQIVPLRPIPLMITGIARKLRSSAEKRD
jgi:anaerobic magnesium-protoporphyrin IX monomethyl ester cyclase